MEPMIVNVLSWLGTALGAYVVIYTTYEYVRDARKRRAAKSATRT